MINRLKIEINIQDEREQKVNQMQIFNSIIKKYSTDKYIDFLSPNTLKPYNHYVSKRGEKFFWTINTLTQEARENIILPIIENMPNQIDSNEGSFNISIKDKILEQVTYDNLISRNCLTEEKSNYITIRFESPTSFKSLGNYKILPEMSLIYKSIIMKYNTFSRNYEIDDEDVLCSIIDNTNIIDYRLRSTRFCMENFRIPAFVGNIRIKIKGTIASKNLINLLLDFGTYSGVGLKTSLGMGGIDIEY